MKSKAIGLFVMGMALLCLTVLVVDATISAILMGGRVNVTEMVGTVQYTSNPYSSWTSTLDIQSGAVWRARVENLTVDYTGDMNITWTLYDAGVDGLIGTGDDSVIPSAGFVQTEAMSANVPNTIVSSIDGFNPYNWGQWTSSQMVVYIQTEVTEG